MKVLGILTPFYPPHIGGMERAIYRIATGLSRSGVDVTVHTSAIGSGHVPTDESMGSTVRVVRQGETLTQWSEAACQWAGKSPLDTLLVSSFGPETRKQTAASLRAARTRGVRTVWRSPTADHAHRNLNGAHATVVELIDAVVANSQASADLTQRAISRHVLTVQNLLLSHELKSAALDVREERLCDVAWVGRVALRKRPDDVLAAFRSLRREGLTIHVQATGSYGEADLYEHFIRGVPQGVIVHNPAAEQPAELRRAAVFLHLSQMEGSPNSVLEAAARGTVPITSDIPECRELLVGTPGRHLSTDLSGLMPTVRLALESSTPTSRNALHEHFARKHAEALIVPQWLNVLFG